MTPSNERLRQLQMLAGVVLMSGGFLVGVLCVLTLGASLAQPLSAESYVFWTALLASCLAAIAVSLVLRWRYKQSAHDNQ